MVAVWVCGTGVDFCVGCVTCRERESGIRISCGGVLPGAVDSLGGRFFVVRRGGVGGMGCRSFDVRVVCDEFAVGVGSFFGSTGSAWDWRIWSGLRRFFCSCVGSALGYVLVAAWLCALSCWKTTLIGQVGSWAEVAKIYRCRYSLGGAARIHWMGSAPGLFVGVGCAVAYFFLCRPDGVKRMDWRGFHGWWGWLLSSTWVDGMGLRGLRCGLDLGV